MTTIEPGVVERLQGLLEKANELRPDVQYKPGGLTGGLTFDERKSLREWADRVTAARAEIVNALPSLLALLAQQQARIGELLLVAGNAAEQFRAYERHHRAKAEGIEPVGRGFVITAQRDAILNKAERNRQMAEMCEAAIAKEPT